MTFILRILIMVKTCELSAIVTKSAVWAYRFGERWIEFGIAIKTFHDSFWMKYNLQLLNLLSSKSSP